MTAPFSQGDALQVDLAKLGGVDLTSSTQLVTYVGMIGTFLTGTFGHDWGVAKNASTIAYAGFALICVGHAVARAIHHHGVEQANGQVKVALIHAATVTGTPTFVDSAPNIEGVVDPLPEAPTVVNDAVPAATDVSQGLTTVDTTTADPVITGQ